jgi:mRNA interferase MazF
MRPGDVVLIRLPQVAGGPPKLRPALVLVLLPGPFQNVLLCGISTQLQGVQPGWDESVDPSDADFRSSGLRSRPAIRLSYLYAAERGEVSGVIGRIDRQRLSRLIRRLTDLLAVSV